MNAIAIFAVAGMITFVLRSSMVLFGDRLNSSAIVESAIGLVSPAVLAAIIASALLLDRGHVVQPDIAGILAVAGAVVAVRRTSNVSLALAVGLPIYWCCSATFAFAGLG